MCGSRKGCGREEKGQGRLVEKQRGWMAARFADAGAREGLCCLSLGETLNHSREGMELPHILCHSKGKTGNHPPQALGDIYWDREEVSLAKFTAGKKTTTKLPILINSNISSFLPVRIPFPHAILDTSLYRTAPLSRFTLKSPCLHFYSLVAPAPPRSYCIFSDRKSKQEAARLTEEETHATFSFYLP